MRACIKVKCSSDLWVMQNRPDDRGGLAGTYEHDHGAEGDY